MFVHCIHWNTSSAPHSTQIDINNVKYLWRVKEQEGRRRGDCKTTELPAITILHLASVQAVNSKNPSLTVEHFSLRVSNKKDILLYIFHNFYIIFVLFAMREEESSCMMVPDIPG